MGPRVLACRGLTKKRIQCANPIGCFHHSCKDDGCHRRQQGQPHTAHNIPCVPPGNGETYVLDQSEKARRAANNHGSSVVDGDLLRAIEESQEMADVEKDAELIRDLLEYSNSTRDTSTPSTRDTSIPSTGDTLIPSMGDTSTPSTGDISAQTMRETSTQTTEEDVRSERHSPTEQNPLDDARLIYVSQGSEEEERAEGQDGEGDEAGAGRTQGYGQRESSLDLLLREFPDVMSPTVAEGRADTSSGSLPEIADAVSQDTTPQVNQDQRERRVHFLPRTLSIIDENLADPEPSLEDDEQYVQSLRAAQAMVSSLILEQSSAGLDDPRQEVYRMLHDVLRSAELMGYYRAANLGERYLETAMNCLLVLFLHSEEDDNHQIREKIEHALSILDGTV